MPRKNLIRTDLYPYHVFIRCNNKEWFDLPLKSVWSICLESLKEASEVHPVDIQSFVLMSNHYHLLIWTPNSNIDKFMYEFNKRISQRIRAKTLRINRIFGDRYKWSLITSEKYYFSVEKYIYQNPIAAGLTKRCEDYPFSSLYYIAHKIQFPVPLLHRGTIEKETIEEFNNYESLEKRALWSKALLKANFKPPTSQS